MNRWIVLAIALDAVPAGAGPLADAIARHSNDDVGALRARLPDPGARCALGAVYAQRADLPRAQLYLDTCDDAAIEPEIADAVAHARAEVGKKLRASELSRLTIETNPPGMIAETDALPGERVMTPATIWVRAGSYHVRAASEVASLDGKAITNTVDIAAYSSGTIVLDGVPRAVGDAKPGTVKFEEQGDIGEHESGPPPAVQHKPLMPHKFIDGGTTGGPQIDDPLAAEAEPPPPPVPPSFALGMRAGAGAFGGSIGASAALVAALAAPRSDADDSHPWQLIGRVDWRTGSAFGGNAGIARVIAAPDAAWISLGAAARAQVATGAMTGTSFGAAASLDLALRRLPVALSARFEQELTGSRDRAFVIEAGFDLRRFQPITSPR